MHQLGRLLVLDLRWKSAQNLVGGPRKVADIHADYGRGAGCLFGFGFPVT